MKLDRYQKSEERRRLSGNLERRGSRTGLSPGGAFLFGGVFVAAGVAIMLVGGKVIPVDPKTVHAPYWVVTIFGTVFALAGGMVWSMGGKELLANRRRAEAQRRYAHEPALMDYPWNPDGFTAPRWARAGKALGGAVFFTIFLSMFNWWAFGEKGPWMLKIIVMLFDLLALAVWWETVIRLGRAIKFGGSRVVPARFPSRVTEPVILRWRPAAGVVKANKGSFTLRCVEEWFEVRGSGENRSSSMVHEQIWSGTWHLEQARTFQANEEIELQFPLCADLPPTQLSADRPTFWELEVKLDLPGLDFVETYLVPIY